MTEASPAYRDRAAQVRGAARAHLLLLREERIAARVAARLAETPVAEIAPEVPPDLTPDAVIEPTVIPAAKAQPAKAAPKVPLSPRMQKLFDARATPTAVAAPEALIETPVEMSVEVSAEPSVEAVLEAPCAPEIVSEAEAQATPVLDPAPTADAPLPEEAHIAEASLEDASADLARLPGAGPGLIWMLNQCDIHTLAELAQADCTALTARMGLAGRILDLGGWIDFARAAQPAPEPR